MSATEEANPAAEDSKRAPPSATAESASASRPSRLSSREKERERERRRSSRSRSSSGDSRGREMVGGCCVCADERGWDENPLVYCDGEGCSVAVHQGMWGGKSKFIRDCELVYPRLRSPYPSRHPASGWELVSSKTG